MIESKERDSGGYNQSAESTTAAAEVPDVRDGEEHADRLLNTVFADKYLIQEVLGAGGMSVVYLARHEALNKLVAIKTLHTHLTSKNSSLMRFKQEAQAASRLQHPGIVAMHDYGVTDDGTPYLVMDYVSGESLADLLSNIHSLTCDAAMDIFKQTVAAIAHAHQRGIVHRDIKPSNIMLNFDNQNKLHVKIVDFGVAKFVESEEDTKLTQTGEALGSPLYMSPEQCLGQQLDIRSDIYSFGCVMYEAITGVPAVSSDGVFKTMMKHIHDVPPSFKEVRPDLSDTEALERIVFKALAKDPGKRYQHMDEMLADLEAVHQQKGIARKIKNKFELTGLRQTTKSINFMVASSVLIGALILFGANYIITTTQSLASAPALMSEPPIWQPYADKPSVTEKDEEEHNIKGSLLGLVIEGDKQSLSTEEESGKSKKLSALGFELVTKAASERKHHEYDLAESTYSDAINNILRVVTHSNDMQRANAQDKLLLAYLGKGDCEYFKPVPNYLAASESYNRAVSVLRKIKAEFLWPKLQPVEQLYLFLRNADSLHMQGRYAHASAARLVIPELMRAFERGIRDGSYGSLTASKIAEEAFRQNRLAEAKELYKEALNGWQKDGDGFVREQAIATGRLAEIGNLQGATDSDSLFIDFDALAQKLERNDPKLLKTQFFADAYQDYANYLWQHHDVVKALEMHQRSVKYSP